VVVPNARLLEQLPALLPGVTISVGPTPSLDRTMASLREQVQQEPVSGETLALATYLTQDVTPAAVASFFEAAKALYERTPWLLVPSDGHLLQVSSTALGIRGWVGCVIGQNQENYGVILFDSLAAYKHYVQIAKDIEQEGYRPNRNFPRHRSINFEAKAAMPPGLLNDIKRYHWPVAKGAGYPTVMLIEPDLTLAPPSRADLRRLEGVARALVRLIDDVPDLAHRWQPSALLRKRYRVLVAGEEVSVSIGLAGEAEAEEDAASTVMAASEAEARTGTGAGAAPSQANTKQPKPSPKERVPAALQAKVDSLMAPIDHFCASQLNGEYRQLIHAAVCALARKRPSPLLTGREPSWAAGVVHAIGLVNFLFDKTQSPHCKAPDIYSYFGVSNQTGQAHSKKIRDLLKIGMFDPKWTLPSQLDNSPMAWMLEVDGFILDIRTLPLEIQVEAYARGLIPYVPALRQADESAP
jgi:hypothetical protein